MRKNIKVLSAIIILIIAILMSACGQNALFDFQKGMEKNKTIQSGKRLISGEMAVTFNQDLLTEEELKELSEFDKIVFEMNMSYDSKEDISEMLIYNKVGKAGQDMDIYQKGEQIFMKLPMSDKYVDFASNEEAKKDEKYIASYDEMFKEVSNEIMNVLNSEDVVSGKNIVIETKDGDVKVKEYSINFTEEQSNVLLEKLKPHFEENLQIYITENEDIENSVPINSFIEDISLEYITGKAYIDIDGYLIEQEYSVKGIFPNDNKIKEIIITGKITNWDINKKQEIIIPDISEKDLLKQEEIEDYYKEMFEE